MQRTKRTTRNGWEALAIFLVLGAAGPAPANAAPGPQGRILETGPDRTNLVTADLNGDGRLDLAFTMPATNKLVTVLNVGDGTLGTRNELVPGIRPGELAARDLNNNGTLDLVVATTGEAKIAVLLGAGNGTFTPGTPVTLPGLAGSVALGDLDEDGTIDLIAASVFPSQILFLHGNGNGTFATPPLTLRSPLARAANLNVLDYDNDGHLDVVALVLDNTVLVGHGLGGASFNWTNPVLPPEDACCFQPLGEPLRIIRYTSGVFEAWIYGAAAENHGIPFGENSYWVGVLRTPTIFSRR